jgi:hypothetical protein
MLRPDIAQIIIDSARDMGEESGTSVITVLVNYWVVAYQFLDQLDPHAVALIDESLKKLRQDEIKPQEFQASLDKPSLDLEQVLDLRFKHKNPH